MSTFKPSPQQAQYFNWIENGKGSALLEAVAGSGKTTTLIQGLIRMNGDVFFGAYNKKIAEEIQNKTNGLKLTCSLNVSTMHSAGFAIWRRSQRNVQVDGNKLFNAFSAVTPEEQADFRGPVCDLVSFAKQAGFGILVPGTDDDWYDLIDHFSVECHDQEDRVIDLARKTLFKSNSMTGVVDFDDMIYLPLLNKSKPVKEYDWVLIDEAQDTNATRRALALLMLKRGGRLVAVGDPHQAIYGFTGADSDALELIASAVSASRIPLTVSYRCPKKVTELARTWVNHIESHPDAKDGLVMSLGKHEDLYPVVKPGDAILCRFNAPIIGMAYKFISDGIPAKIEGRDIGNGLKALARRWKVKSVDKFLDKLDDWREKESTKLRIRQKESLAVAVEDKARCLGLLVERVTRINPNVSNVVEALCGEIDKLFGDDVKGNVILLSSVHKSKGREWSRVFWLQMGEPKWLRKDWEKQCELNLNYVAATRAMSELYLVPAPPKEK